MPRLNEETGLKECSKCHEHKLPEMFYTNKFNVDGLHLQCKECSKNYTHPNAGSVKVKEKRCSSCKITKDISNFTKCSKATDGHNAQCKDCSAEYKKSLKYNKNLDILYKKCASCKETKSILEFNSNLKSKDGYTYSCRYCFNSRGIKYDRDAEVLFKTCSCCNTIKPAIDFYSDKSSKDGMSYHCAECVKERTKRILSTDEGKTTSKNSYSKRMSEPLYASKIRIRKSISSIFVRNKLKKKSKTYEILNCDYIHFKEYIENLFSGDMSWDNFGDIHLDHIIPISMANDESEIIRLNHYTNLQPLWKIDNLEKNNKIIPEMIESHFENYPDSPAYKFYLDNIKGQNND